MGFLLPRKEYSIEFYTFKYYRCKNVNNHYFFFHQIIEFLEELNPRLQIHVHQVIHLISLQEQECLKRQVKCTYCEMDVAKGELDDHLEYCGTRTENCVLCGQFIMVKDMARHEESRCSYGGVQPKSNPRTSVSVPTAKIAPAVSSRKPPPPTQATDMSDDFLFGSGELNTFQMDEIQRLLGANGMGASHQSGSTSGARSTAFCGTTQMATSKNKKKEVNIQRQNRNGEVNHSLDHGTYAGRY